MRDMLIQNISNRVSTELILAKSIINKKFEQVHASAPVQEVIQIANETSFSTARIAAKIEGLPIGISSGAALAAGIEVAKRKEMKNKRIVVIIPSFAERYLSTELFN